MSQLDWPINPNQGDTWTQNGKTWVWNGYAWDSIGEVVDGPTGPIGATGPIGPTGPTGPTSIPTGGATGDILVKSTNSDWDTEWTDQPIVDKLRFDLLAAETLLDGEIAWNDEAGTLQIGIEGGNVLDTGEHVLYRVLNQSGSLIPKGTLVMSVGTVGGSGKILVEPWDGSQPSVTILGIAYEDIPTENDPIETGYGYVVHFGKVRNQQTNGANYGEIWVDGDIVYANPTGGLTKFKPDAPAPKVTVALIIKSSSNNGTLFVRPTLGSSIADDELVYLTGGVTGLQDGELLAWSETNQRFENVPATNGIYGKPWGIFDSNGNVTTYATFALAKAAAVQGDTIHMFCNVTETGSVSLDPEGISVDFNGHTYTLDSTSTAPAILINNDAVSWLYNGTIIRKGYTDILPTGAGVSLYVEDSVVNLDGMRIISENEGDSIALVANANTGKIAVINSDKTIAEANSTGTFGTAYSIYAVGQSSKVQGSTSIFNLHVTGGAKIFGQNCLLSNITGVADTSEFTSCDLEGLEIRGIADITGGFVNNCSFTNDNQLNVAAITMRAAQMRNTNGLVNASGTGTGIRITGTSAIKELSLINCIGQGRDTAYAGIEINNATGGYTLIGCVGVSTNNAKGIFLKGSPDLVFIDCSIQSSGGTGLEIGSGASGEIINMDVYTSGSVPAVTIDGTGFIYRKLTVRSLGDGQPAIATTVPIILLGFNIFTRGIGISCLNSASPCAFIDGHIVCARNNASDHGIVLLGSDSVHRTFISVQSTSANCLNAASAINVSYSQNMFLNATTPVNANITQVVTATEDNQGNITI